MTSEHRAAVNVIQIQVDNEDVGGTNTHSSLINDVDASVIRSSSFSNGTKHIRPVIILSESLNGQGKESRGELVYKLLEVFKDFPGQKPRLINVSDLQLESSVKSKKVEKCHSGRPSDSRTKRKKRHNGKLDRYHSKGRHGHDRSRSRGRHDRSRSRGRHERFKSRGKRDRSHSRGRRDRSQNRENGQNNQCLSRGRCSRSRSEENLVNNTPYNHLYQTQLENSSMEAGKMNWLIDCAGKEIVNENLYQGHSTKMCKNPLACRPGHSCQCASMTMGTTKSKSKNRHVKKISHRKSNRRCHCSSSSSSSSSSCSCCSSDNDSGNELFRQSAAFIVVNEVADTEGGTKCQSGEMGKSGSSGKGTCLESGVGNKDNVDEPNLESFSNNGDVIPFLEQDDHVDESQIEEDVVTQDD